MARKPRKTKRAGQTPGLGRAVRTLRRQVLRAVLIAAVVVTAWVAALCRRAHTHHGLHDLRTVPSRRIEREWVPMEDISVHLRRAAVAAEDANFCLHWVFDMEAIRDAIDAGAARGGSTISQQTVKNAFSLHGRSWLRKALEAAITPLMEGIWSKRRIREVYLNVAEFDEGVFGAEAAARHHFGVSAADLTPEQAARLAAVLPAPQDRSASRPSDFVTRRAAAIADGAATIRADGRDDCFAN